MMWPAAEQIGTDRLTLEPLRVEHAVEMAPALDDEALHEYIGGHPATPEELTDRYARLVAGAAQGWLNWVIRRRDTGAVVGTVQATMYDDHVRSADIAWVIATPQQGQGYATEAASAMAAWLRRRGAAALVAYVHPDHGASAGVARHLGLAPTADLVDGETRWLTAE